VNLLLVDPAELTGDATCTLRDRRAQHLRSVLGAAVGSQVRAGVIGGGIGRAELLADDGTAITLRLTLTEPAPAPLPIELVLAIPRPKVLTRVIEAAAAFGVARIELTNAWRVDKSYLHSPRLAPDALALAARLGAEQGASTHLPEIAVYHRLMALLDARWPGPPAVKLVAHPGAPPIETAVMGPPAPLALRSGRRAAGSRASSTRSSTAGSRQCRSARRSCVSRPRSPPRSASCSCSSDSSAVDHVERTRRG